MNDARSRRRLHLGEPSHCAGERDEAMEGRDGLFASEGDAAEAFDPVEEALDEVALLVEHPVDGFGLAACRVLLDLRDRPKFVGDEVAQVIRVIARIRNDMTTIVPGAKTLVRISASPKASKPITQ